MESFFRKNAQREEKNEHFQQLVSGFSYPAQNKQAVVGALLPLLISLPEGEAPVEKISVISPYLQVDSLLNSIVEDKHPSFFLSPVVHVQSGRFFQKPTRCEKRTLRIRGKKAGLFFAVGEEKVHLPAQTDILEVV